MKEHPIPQDVTGYKFHIVGNMTLGQFAQIAVGAGLAFLIYNTNLYDVIKWPLMLLVFGVGAMAAFVPIADRPISHWIATFVRILYKPTQYYWQREVVIPDFFNFVSSSSQTVVLPELDLTPVRRQKIHEYISSSKSRTTPDQEASQIAAYTQHIYGLFSSISVTQPQSVVVHVEKPQLKVRLRSMRSQPSTPLSLETAVAMGQPTVVTEVNTPQESIVDTIPDQYAMTTPQPPVETYTSDIILSAQAYEQSMQNSGVHSVDVPDNNPTPVGATAEESVEPEKIVVAPVPTPQTTFEQIERPPAPPNNSAKATFNKQLPFPSRPTTPNKLVGMVLTSTDDLLNGAIVEIKTTDGQIVRAVRTNALGQFYITTPLKNGDYIIVTSSDGYQFEPVTIHLKGKILDPIEVRST